MRKGFENLLIGLARSGSKQKDPVVERENLKNALIEEAEAIKRGVNDLNLNEKSRQFFKLVRKAFRELFSIKYECTFEELKKEIELKKIQGKLKSEIRVFLEETDRLEYGFADLESNYRSKKAREREEIMSYLHELENEGKKVDKKLRRELDGLFKENVSDASRLLVKHVNEFKALLKRL